MIHKISEFLWERGRDLTKGKKGKDINVLPKEVGQKDAQKEEEWKDENIHWVLKMSTVFSTVLTFILLITIALLGRYYYYPVLQVEKLKHWVK